MSARKTEMFRKNVSAVVAIIVILCSCWTPKSQEQVLELIERFRFTFPCLHCQLAGFRGLGINQRSLHIDPSNIIFLKTNKATAERTTSFDGHHRTNMLNDRMLEERRDIVLVPVARFVDIENDLPDTVTLRQSTTRLSPTQIKRIDDLVDSLRFVLIQ